MFFKAIANLHFLSFKSSHPTITIPKWAVKRQWGKGSKGRGGASVDGRGRGMGGGEEGCALNVKEGEGIFGDEEEGRRWRAQVKSEGIRRRRGGQGGGENRNREAVSFYAGLLCRHCVCGRY